MKSSLIITIYKSTEALNRVLETVRLQKVKPSEVIVTEDGEFMDNLKLINEWKAKLDLPLVHITQKDIGNRKPLALNKAILRSTGEYLIFIDGDCLLRSDFIASHLAMADEKSFLTGRRVELSKRATEFLTAQRVASGYLDSYSLKLYWDALFGETHHLGRFFKTPKIFRKILDRHSIDDIRGCNFSVHKKHLVAINGFGNHFSGAYGEDSDVEYRLKFLGLQMKSNKGSAIQFHMWHKTQTKDEGNQILLQEVLRRGVARTDNGLQEAASVP